jgi:ACS family glucarate transporter-like MFS transporter
VTRWLVVAGLFVLSLITYVDRAAISSAKDAIAADLKLSDQQMGAAFSAFALGYAAAQVPSGWLADRYGPRGVLAAIVALWSALTAFTGFARSLGVMLAARFLFGAAEAGAFPGAARAFKNWLPQSEHGRANGVIFAGARLGAALAFPLMAWLLESWTWRVSFYVLAAPGLLWAVSWMLWFRDHPAQPPFAEASNQTRPSEAPLGVLLRSRGVLLAMFQYFAVNFTTFLTLSWMLPYLKQQYRLTAPEAAWYAMLPLIFGAGGQWATGTMVDLLHRSRYTVWSRALPAMSGFALSAGGLVALAGAATVEVAVVCLIVASFGAEMAISPSWAWCLDIGGRHAAALSGGMNMAGNFGSFVSANLFPWMHSLTGSASAYFLMVAAMNLVSVLCWARMRNASAIVSAEAAARTANREA